MKLKRLAAIVLSICTALTMSITASAEWFWSDGGYKYRYANGDIADEGWLHIGANTYYIQEDGTMKTGWIETKSGSKYYCRSDGKLLKNTWAKGNNGAVYYFGVNGRMYQNEWLVKNSTTKYYFGPNGKMWRDRWIHTSSDSWYYVFNSGKAAISRTLYFSGIPYSFDKNGRLIRGTSSNSNVTVRADSESTNQSVQQNPDTGDEHAGHTHSHEDAPAHQDIIYAGAAGTGARYHFNKTCNGVTYKQITWDDVANYGYTPCERCAI